MKANLEKALKHIDNALDILRAEYNNGGPNQDRDKGACMAFERIVDAKRCLILGGTESGV